METLTPEAPASLATASAETNEAPTSEELQSTINGLRTSLTEARVIQESLRQQCEQARQDLTDYRTKVAHDCDILSEKLIAEADRRGWCAEYDEIVADLNEKFQALAIQDRISEFEVEVEISATVATTTYVTVKARSQEDAENCVSSEYDSYLDAEELLADAVRYNGFQNVDLNIG